MLRSAHWWCLAVFDRRARAVRAALGIVEAAHRFGLDVRVGVHPGEVERRGDDIGGIAGDVAARIMEKHPPVR